MADIVATDAARRDLAVLHGCRLDVEFGGSGSNSIELKVEVSSGQRVEPGAVVYVDGTEYGGVVDKVSSDSAEGVLTYSGRSWHGMLAKKVICPPAGQDHRTASGEANAALLAVIGLLGLSEVMTASSEDSGVQIASYQFARYVDGYTGLRGMLASAGARLAIAYDSRIGRAVLSAVPAVDWSAGIDSDMAGVEVTRVHRCANHLISLGTGEGAQRVVRHDYIGADGSVTTVPYYTGVDEICEVYDYPNASAEDLAEDGPERLLELQEADSLDATLEDAPVEYAVGDVVPGTDIETGASVAVEVDTKIAVVTDLAVSIEYKAGGARVASSSAR